MRCGAINCGRTVVIAYLLKGGRSTVLLSCEDCRGYFSRDRMPASVLVREIPLGELPVHEVMEESEFQENWDPGSVSFGKVGMLGSW